jgi:hypothetical protein
VRLSVNFQPERAELTCLRGDDEIARQPRLIGPVDVRQA